MKYRNTKYEKYLYNDKDWADIWDWVKEHKK